MGACSSFLPSSPRSSYVLAAIVFVKNVCTVFVCDIDRTCHIVILLEKLLCIELFEFFLKVSIRSFLCRRQHRECKFNCLSRCSYASFAMLVTSFIGCCPPHLVNEVNVFCQASFACAQNLRCRRTFVRYSVKYKSFVMRLNVLLTRNHMTFFAASLLVLDCCGASTSRRLFLQLIFVEVQFLSRLLCHGIWLVCGGLPTCTCLHLPGLKCSKPVFAPVFQSVMSARLQSIMVFLVSVH